MKIKVNRIELITALQNKLAFFEKERKEKEVNVMKPVADYEKAALKLIADVKSNIKLLKSAKTPEKLQEMTARGVVKYLGTLHAPSPALAGFERGQITEITRIIKALKLSNEEYISCNDESDNYLRYL